MMFLSNTQRNYFQRRIKMQFKQGSVFSFYNNLHYIHSNGEKTLCNFGLKDATIEKGEVLFYTGDISKTVTCPKCIAMATNTYYIFTMECGECDMPIPTDPIDVVGYNFYGGDGHMMVSLDEALKTREEIYANKAWYPEHKLDIYKVTFEGPQVREKSYDYHTWVAIQSCCTHEKLSEKIDILLENWDTEYDYERYGFELTEEENTILENIITTSGIRVNSIV